MKYVSITCFCLQFQLELQSTDYLTSSASGFHIRERALNSIQKNLFIHPYWMLVLFFEVVKLIEIVLKILAANISERYFNAICRIESWYFIRSEINLTHMVWNFIPTKNSTTLSQCRCRRAHFWAKRSENSCLELYWEL